MPPLPLPLQAQVHPRLATSATGADGAETPPLTITTIVVIACAGMLPVIIVSAFAVWLLAFYGRRPCCPCVKRRQRLHGSGGRLHKSQKAQKEHHGQIGGSVAPPNASDSSVSSTSTTTMTAPLHMIPSRSTVTTANSGSGSISDHDVSVTGERGERRYARMFV